MHTPDPSVLREVVLVGGGHSHAGVLERFGRRPVPGMRLTVISRDSQTPYSGMLPGYIAGHYRRDEMHIDLPRLAKFAGARFFRDEAVGLDRAARAVHCRDHAPVSYDGLSINIGSMPRMDDVEGAREHAIAVKPIDAFGARWLALLDRVRRHAGVTRIAVVGAGAGGVELTLAMQFRLCNEMRAVGRDPAELRFHLLDAETEILPTHNAAVRKVFARVLDERGVVIHRNTRVRQITAGSLRTADGASLDVDEVVWVTRASGAPWLRESGLALDAEGFIQVNDRLQSVTDPSVFAAGDIASLVGHQLEKAGVFAVRQARPLAENLRRAVQGRELLAYRPQRQWLALISTGDRFAVASRGRLCLSGHWVWRWKDWIDRRFMARHRDLPAISG